MKDKNLKIENKILHFTLLAPYVKRSFIILGSFCILIFAFCIFAVPAAYASEASGTIASGGNNGYAWSNQTGWVNFGCSNCGISIVDSGITGHAWSNNYGWINMSPANGGVTIAANGALSGYAWGSGLGWINFSGVSINSSGKFTGQASGAIIGALSFDCANCSVTTDFRAQNFRTVALALTTVVSGGGVFGAVGGGVLGAPAHISSFNAPMKLLPVQSGILTQNLANQKSVILDVPNNVYSDDITFIIKEEVIFSDIITPNISVVGNVLLDISAWDKTNRPAHSFLKPVKITLNIPELLAGQSDLGVYFFNEAKLVWVKIPEAVFSGDSVSFSVDHLTLFAIFAGPELPLAVAPTFPVPIPFEFAIPRPEIEVPGGEQVPEGEVPAEEVLEENPPLFDIEVSPGPSPARRILGAGGESKRTRTLIVLAVLIIAAGGATFYFLRRRKN